MQFNLAFENINYIKISCKDKFNNPWIVKAAIKRMDSREIFACAKFEDSLILKTPQDIELSIACSDGLYYCNTTLTYVQIDAPYLFFAIKAPETMEHRQQREYFRVKMNNEASISYLVADKLQRKTCKIYDISANGVRLATDNIISDIQEATINISLAQRTITAKAKYTRCDNEDDILKMAFQFTEILENDRDFISQQCIKQQLENKRNSISKN